MSRFLRVSATMLIIIALVALSYLFIPDRIRFPVLASEVLIGFIALVVACIFIVPARLVARDTDIRVLTYEQLSSSKNNVRTTLVQGLVGFAAFLGIVATWYQFGQELTLSRQGQTAERFSRAIDQLAGPRPEIRLGGIYGLERLAKSTSHDQKDERLTIYEVLTAYVRQHVPNNDSSAEKYNRARQPWLSEPLLEIQAVLTVLGRRETALGDPRLNLSYVYLREVNLPGANLQEVDLSESNLGRANLTNADLQKASFLGSDLQKAHLDHADLRGADFSNAIMYGSKLVSADLGGAKLCGANLEGAFLDSANLRGATADANTVWPSMFDWRQSGVRLAKSYPHCH